jgi:hypothetical protein
MVKTSALTFWREKQSESLLDVGGCANVNYTDILTQAGEGSFQLLGPILQRIKSFGFGHSMLWSKRPQGWSTIVDQPL